MYNYHRRYMRQQCSDPNSNELSPESESNYEMENFENETSNESESEYELNPEFNNQQNFEGGRDYENEVLGVSRGYNVHAPGGMARSGNPFHSSPLRSAFGSSRYGSPYRAGAVFRSPGSAFYGHNASVYRRAPFGGFGGQYNNYNRFGWNRWHHRYPGSLYNTYGAPDMDQSAPYPQDTSAGAPPAGPGGSPTDSITATINSLAQQVAATNANVQAIQNTISNAGKPDPSSMPPPDNSMPPGGGQAPPGQTPAPSKEMEDYEYEMENEMYGGGNEVNEMELAAELLSTNNEMELDHFLGGLLGGLGGPLKGLLGGVIKKALPIAGAAAGTFFGGPIGTMIGGQIGSAASNMFELELEGLSSEDQEFEVAKALIRLITDAAKALANGHSTGDPNEDAKNALIHAAAHHAPGLLVKKHHHHHHHGHHNGHHHGEHGHGGHWFRRGNKIVIENAF
jgi:hypothetical protein